MNQELLDRLREADPDMLARVTVPVADEISHCTRCDAWLQQCLQESIRARGWGLGFGVTWGYSSAIISIDLGKTFIREAGGTEADALLRAYLAAIEVEKNELSWKIG